MENGLKLALEAVGGTKELAAQLSISQSAVAQWTRVPAERVSQIERQTGIARSILRPDLYGSPVAERFDKWLFGQSDNTSQPEETRKRLPHRRGSTTFEFEHAGLKYVCSYSSFDDDGRVAEIFLQSHKGGSSSDIASRECAIAASLALQHGCSLETLQHALLRNPNGEPAGALGHAVDLITADNAPSTNRE
jgi:DNA-binding transcriptional regulator YdaS (Cro superfamily)